LLVDFCYVRQISDAVVNSLIEKICCRYDTYE
jgi:hypothetical protein